MEQQSEPQSGDQNNWQQGNQPEYDSSTNPTDAAPDDATAKSAQAGREMLVQLQQMIDTITTQAAPVVRDVAVKAAELAAVAGEKAGPVAYRAAGATESIGQRVAAKSKEWAAGLRRMDEGATGTSEAGPPDDQVPVGGSEPSEETAQEAAQAFMDTLPSTEGETAESDESQTNSSWNG